ncbi:acyl-CoA carboxylase subunit epsilon [Phytohabitans kaempferiae]|uniref:Acyl-CoA carboxylase subunit epsilon n=1 Tax=Phytohabitans kaempferiae TaxID=1620943 RepID=A0ABV6M074_9ACTN
MSEPQPFFRVVRGTPTAEELAALVGAVMSRRRATVPDNPGPAVSAWARSARPGGLAAAGWRLSASPR